MYAGAARRLVAFGQTGLSCSENALHSMFSRACRAESKKESRGETGSSWISVEPACFAACITGLFFFAPFAYVYFPRSKGLWDGLAAGANWFFRDKSVHINFALEVINTIRADPPGTFRCRVRQTDPSQAGRWVDCETAFAKNLLGQDATGLSLKDMHAYLEWWPTNICNRLG
jgi:ribonucleotide reductase beta subunit family protein with ferritin-like domain